MCHETTTLYRCGHETVRVQKCPEESSIRLENTRGKAGDYFTVPVQKNLCAGILQYPPVLRDDLCLDCWAAQPHVVETTEKPPLRTEVDLSPQVQYGLTDPISDRRLFREIDPSKGRAAEAKARFWTPARYRMDDDEKEREKFRAASAAGVVKGKALDPISDNPNQADPKFYSTKGPKGRK